MRKILLLLCIPFVGIAQTDYELTFNSATLDYVEMTNASAVIANKTAFSVSCWVYSEANTNHGGIIGLRNNTDADFYLLQLQNTNNIEARFRNSSGINYDIVAANALDFNQWQHLAFTYDGSYIRLYKNGIIVDSTAANGTITQTTQSFNLGMLDYQGSAFHLNGRLDEIRLWDVALSQTEINSWMCTPIDLTHPNYNNLMGYWRLNDGQGTIAVDQTANGNNGTLMGGTQWQISTTCFGSTTPPLTYVPDDNFETYLEANGMGDGIALNDYVFTSAIDTVTYLDVSLQSISDLTGIEDFTLLIDLNCSNNQLISLDVSQNIVLKYLECHVNQLTTLDVSNNIVLDYLYCSVNQITSIDLSGTTALSYLGCKDNQLASIDVSNNTALIYLACWYNQLTSLDVSANTALTSLICEGNQLTSLVVSQNTALELLNCSGNQLTSLDVSVNTSLTFLRCNSNLLTSLELRNGNNINTSIFYSVGNPNLTCINVDDASWSATNWTNIDFQHYFSNDCNATAIEETTNSEKELLKITDVLGREVLENTDQPLFYIYNNGTVKKKRIIE